MKRQHEEKDMGQQRKPENDLDAQMRILKRTQALEKDAGIMQAVVFVGLWLLIAAAVICYAACR